MLNKKRLAYVRIRKDMILTMRFVEEDDDDDDSGMSWHYKVVTGPKSCIGDMLWVSPEGWMEGYTFKTTVTNNKEELNDG